MAKKIKADFINAEDAKDKASLGLLKAKAMEAKLKEDLKTIKIHDGTEITSNKREVLNDYIKSYGKL